MTYEEAARQAAACADAAEGELASEYGNPERAQAWATLAVAYATLAAAIAGAPVVDHGHAVELGAP